MKELELPDLLKELKEVRSEIEGLLSDHNVIESQSVAFACSYYREVWRESIVESIEALDRIIELEVEK